MKLTREKNNKPLFWEYILYNPEAFRVVFIMSIVMGILISLSLVVSSFVFGWYGEIKVILCIVFAFNLYNTFKFIRNPQYINVSISEMVFNKKPKRKKHGNNR
jgi:hypothetical protein